MECNKGEVERLTDDLKKFIEETKQKIDFYESVTFSMVVDKECQNPSNFHILDENDTFWESKGLCENTILNSIGKVSLVNNNNLRLVIS